MLRCSHLPQAGTAPAARRAARGLVAACVLAAMAAGGSAVRAAPPAAEVRTGLQETEETPERLWDRIQAAISESRFSEAEELLHRYMKLEPNDEAPLAELARVLSWQNRYDEALELYNTYLTQYAYDLDVAVERARILTWKGQLKEAEEEVRKVLDREPEHVDANLLLAGLLEWQGKLDEATAVYQNVLRLDPDNETARAGRQDMERPPGPALESSVSYLQDTSDFIFFASRAGVRIHTVRSFSFFPFGQGAMITDRGNPWLWGAGGGVGARWQATGNLIASAETDALYYPGAGDALDWGGELAADWTALEWLGFIARLGTHLYGPLGQSLASLTAGVRYYRLGLQADLTLDPWLIGAEISETLLMLDGSLAGMATTGTLSPRVRIWGESPRLVLGTRHWYTGYTDPAPQALYWSPKYYNTHSGLLRVEWQPVTAAELYGEGSGGIGFSLDHTAAGAAAQEWTSFAVFGAAAGARVAWNAQLETGLEGWMSRSQRDLGSYMMWNAVFDLTYRW